MNEPILAIDQGTSSTKTVIFDSEGRVLARANEPLESRFKPGGWVEQDPEAIYQNVLASVGKAVRAFSDAGHDVSSIRVCGISNQRETFVVWDETGTPLYPAVVWQCKRSVGICRELADAGLADTVNARTGLLIDPYFSGTKMIWLYRNVPRVREAVDRGTARFGTVDSWLLYKLTGGRSYMTDHTNASRTLFFNLDTLDWDRELLDLFGLSGLNLPAILPSAASYGDSDFEGLFAEPVSITAMIGDSHAAAFGEGCFTPGTAKATLGTGCSILMNSGPSRVTSRSGMVSTICWSTGNRVDYAVEGVIVSCGSTIEWLKNQLGLLADSRESEALAEALDSNGGVYLVPAFSGLGAPYWEMDRKASVTGLTFDCSKAHVVRAALESVPYQVHDVLLAMEADTGIPVDSLMLNGGMTSNGFVLRFMADLLRPTIFKSETAEASAWGAASLAALGSGMIADPDALAALPRRRTAVVKGADASRARDSYAGWKHAVLSGNPGKTT